MEEFQFTTAIMSTSRGCTRNCSFCSSPDFWRQRKVCWRGRSPENIADEIELIVEKYNIHNFVLLMLVLKTQIKTALDF